MRKMFGHEIPSASEKPETRVLEARKLFDVYKRSVTEGKAEFKALDLVKIDGAFRGNPSFENDRPWLRDQIVNQFDSQPVEFQLDILNHIADDDIELASRLMEKNIDRIKTNYSSRDKWWRLEDAYNKTALKIYGFDRIQEIHEKIGYENKLDKTLRGGVKLNISHLRAPELKDIGIEPIRQQWRNMEAFLKKVEEPAGVLMGWSGESISVRKRFLSEQTNRALAIGVELIEQAPQDERKIAGKKLFELCKKTDNFIKILQYDAGSFSSRTTRDVTLPLDRIDNQEIFNSFIQERKKEEKKNKKQKPDGEEHQKNHFSIELEYQLINAGIKHGMPELVETELPYIEKRLEEVSLYTNDALHESLVKIAETDERFLPLLEKFRGFYKQRLHVKMPNPYDSKEMELVENRLTEFLDPANNWEETAKILVDMRETNEKRSEYNKYFPEKLIDKCTQSLSAVSDEQRKERLQVLEKFCDQSSSMSSYFSEALIRYGLWEDGASYAGKQNHGRNVGKIILEGGEAANEALWKTKGWKPSDAASVIVGQIRGQKPTTLNPIIKLYDRYLTEYKNIDRENYAVEDALEMEKQLQALITKSRSHGKEYIPPFSEEETAIARELIGQYRSFIWDLWQQGRIPYDQKTREQILKMFIEDKRDLAIAELGLSADQKIELPIAAGKMALEQKDAASLKQAIGEAKRLTAYEQNENSRKRVAELEKKQEMLILQTDIAEMNQERLRTLFDKSPYDEEKILNALMDAGRFHDAIVICGNMGQEQIVRRLINKGALNMAEELIKTSPAKALPDRQELLALIAYRQAGGEVNPEASKQINNITAELPALLRAKGMDEQKIFDAVQRHLSPDLQLIVERCVEVMGLEEFLKNAPSYGENNLKYFYINALFDRGKNEEAVRFAVLHENGILIHLLKRLIEADDFRDLEPLLYKITDLDTALEITNMLKTAGQNEIAQKFVKRFAKTINNNSPIFKNIHVEQRDGRWSTDNRASEEEQVKNIANLKQLIFSSGSLESLARIYSLFKHDKNRERFVKPIFEGMSEAGVKPRELSRLLSALGTSGIIWYADFLSERGSRKDISLFIEVIEAITPRDEAMKRHPGLYASAIAASAKEALVEDLRGLSPQERVQKFIDRYNPAEAKDTVLLASISLDKQEWNKFVQALPAEERERAIMLADWYAAPRFEEKNLGSAVEHAAAKLIKAIEAGNLEVLRFSLDTLLSARTSLAASKLTQILLNHLEAGGNIGTTYRIAKALSEMESFKANTVLSEIMSAPNTPDVLSRYIIRLLVENGHLDADLRGYFEEKRISDQAENGERLKDAVGRFRLLMQKYGINPDSSIMRYTEGRTEEEISSSLENMTEQVKNFENEGKYQELGKQLMEDINMRLLYFLRKGGQTRFSLINDYNFAKFTNVLQIGNELERHDSPFEAFEQTLRRRHDPEKTGQIIQNLNTGKFPLASAVEKTVFDCVVDVNSESQIEQARQLAGNTLGRDEFGAFTRAIMYRSFLDRMPGEKKPEEAETLWQNAGQDLATLNAFLRYCEQRLGTELNNLKIPAAIEKNSSSDLPLAESIKEEVPDIGITKIEPAMTALGKKLIDNARKMAQQKKITGEERDRLIDGYQNPETVLPTLLANELPPSFYPAIDEWKSHIQAALQAAREARTMKRGESQIRQLDLRYLDKTTDLPEYLRFADSAMCCFNSKNFQGTGPQQYIARIWKDPLSFVFLIEEPAEEQTDKRNSVGFVFGSYGTDKKGKPVLIFNGVYMDRKTDLAARKIMQTIEQQMAVPLGCKEILVASQHAGRSNYGAEYENTDQEYLRLRAIKQKWGDEPEQSTYDDIGLIAVDAKEGRAQDGMVVNRWAKPGQNLLRKKTS